MVMVMVTNVTKTTLRVSFRHKDNPLINDNKINPLIKCESGSAILGPIIDYYIYFK